jgi:hypothetical protein
MVPIREVSQCLRRCPMVDEDAAGIFLEVPVFQVILYENVARLRVQSFLFSSNCQPELLVSEPVLNFARGTSEDLSPANRSPPGTITIEKSCGSARLDIRALLFFLARIRTTCHENLCGQRLFSLLNHCCNGVRICLTHVLAACERAQKVR